MLLQKSVSWSQIRTKHRLSRFFQPFDVIPHNQDTDHNPQEDSVSARLLSSYGIVRQAGPGTYHLLPLGLRSQRKIENIIDREMERIGCLRVSMPHVTQSSLWKKSGRLKKMGSELITFQDRHDRTQVTNHSSVFIISSNHSSVFILINQSQLSIHCNQPITTHR